MPLTRLTCPACSRTLEIDDEATGQEVECGACFEVFVAGASARGSGKAASRDKKPMAKAVDAPKGKSRSRKRDRDDDDDDDDYDDDDYDPRPSRRRRRYRGERERKSRLAYILLGVFLGGLGVHNFYAGRIAPAVSQLVITLVSIPLMFFCIGFFTVWIPIIWAIVEVIVVDEDGDGVPMAS